MTIGGTHLNRCLVVTEAAAAAAAAVVVVVAVKRYAYFPKISPFEKTNI